MNSLFRLQAPSAADLDSFHQDGYIFYPDVLKEEARHSLTNEILGLDSVRSHLDALDEKSAAPQSYFVRPWNDRGPCGDHLIDDLFVIALLQATIGPNYHFCHSALNLAPRGIGPIPFHQDHHHWKHENPVNLAERDKYYIQLLYYPNGFTLGDRNLKVIPGSHLVAPTAEATPERMLAGAYDAEAGRELKEVRLAVPPGSMVYINARIFHAVEAKPADSPQPYRIFNIDIFKEAGPPHRYTQEIPPEWISTRQSPTQKTLSPRALYGGMLGGLSVFSSAWQHSPQDITIPPSTVFSIQQQVPFSLQEFSHESSRHRHHLPSQVPCRRHCHQVYEGHVHGRGTDAPRSGSSIPVHRSRAGKRYRRGLGPRVRGTHLSQHPPRSARWCRPSSM